VLGSKAVASSGERFAGSVECTWTDRPTGTLFAADSAPEAVMTNTSTVPRGAIKAHPMSSTGVPQRPSWALDVAGRACVLGVACAMAGRGGAGTMMGAWRGGAPCAWYTAVTRRIPRETGTHSCALDALAAAPMASASVWEAWTCLGTRFSELARVAEFTVRPAEATIRGAEPLDAPTRGMGRTSTADTMATAYRRVSPGTYLIAVCGDIARRAETACGATPEAAVGTGVTHARRRRGVLDTGTVPRAWRRSSPGAHLFARQPPVAREARAQTVAGDPVAAYAEGGHARRRLAPRASTGTIRAPVPALAVGTVKPNPKSLCVVTKTSAFTNVCIAITTPVTEDSTVTNPGAWEGWFFHIT